MAARGAVPILRPSTLLRAAPRGVEGRERIDDETTHQPDITTMDESSGSMAEHIIQAVGDRFERRLTEEISRLDRRLTEETSHIDRRLTEEISGVRVEMHKGFGELRAEMATGKEGIIRWAFLFWVSQVGALRGLIAYLK